LIDYLRGDESVYDLLVKQEEVKLSMSTVTMMELMVGAFNKKEILYIQKAFKKIDIIYIDEEISKMAEDFITQYSKSHNLQIDDSFIGATAIKKNLELITYNVSDFKCLPGIKLYQFTNK
jgi:predicted nucleic acid-binding protein